MLQGFNYVRMILVKWMFGRRHKRIIWKLRFEVLSLVDTKIMILLLRCHVVWLIGTDILEEHSSVLKWMQWVLKNAVTYQLPVCETIWHHIQEDCNLSRNIVKSVGGA
jgi:hypothetical protein